MAKLTYRRTTANGDDVYHFIGVVNALDVGSVPQGTWLIDQARPKTMGKVVGVTATGMIWIMWRRWDGTDEERYRRMVERYEAEFSARAKTRKLFGEIRSAVGEGNRHRLESLRENLVQLNPDAEAELYYVDAHLARLRQ
jgi:hypothetical protein